MRRRGRWALGASLAGACGIVVFLLVGGRYLEAWLVPFSGDTQAILPDSRLGAEMLEANLRVNPFLRKYIHRFQARMLLRFVATRHDRPVLARSSDRHALDGWIDLVPRGPGETIGVAEVLSVLRARGWRIVGTLIPRSALVVLPPGDVPGPSMGERESSDFALYDIADLLQKFERFPEVHIQTARSFDTGAESYFSLGDLKTLIEQSTGGSEAWSEPNLIGMDGRVGAILVNAPRELHAEVQKVLENLRKLD